MKEKIQVENESLMTERDQKHRLELVSLKSKRLELIKEWLYEICSRIHTLTPYCKTLAELHFRSEFGRWEREVR